MQDYVTQFFLILSYLSVVLIPFLLVILADLRKLIQTIESARKDDGQIDFDELMLILTEAGYLVKRLFRFFRSKP